MESIQHSRTSGRPLALTLGALALFTTGILGRPDGTVWGHAYDVVLYNAVSVGAALACAGAARRSRADRAAWVALSIACVLSVVGNVLYTLLVAPMSPEPFPSVADLFYLAYYLPLYVAMVCLIRRRVPHFHASMWLDGVIGAFGAGSVAVALLLGPTLTLTDGDSLAAGVSLAYPVADALLIVLLVAVGAVIGIRPDRSILFLGAGMVLTFVGDTIYLRLAATDNYTEGGPLDVVWLAGTALMALAAHTATSSGRSAPGPGTSTARVGWKVLAVPLSCNVASLIVLGAGYGDSLNPAAAWLAIACVLTGIARTVITFREVRGYNEIREQARTDELTGLANRRALLESAATVLATATARNPAALLLLDLDGFKDVNDSLGHHAGDDLLRQVGPRLSAVLRGGDLLARLGGDEFAVLLRDTALDDAERVARTVREAMLEPFAVEGIRLHVGVSIGLATAPVPATTVAELLRCADVAMYVAKGGREGVHVYVPDPQDGAGDRLRTMEELRTALGTDELEVHLQPQVELATGAVAGAEALVRWRHPTRGLLSPADLLPAAEQAGLMRPLTDRVLALSLAAASQWWHRWPVPVSVNLSAANVSDLDLPLKVARALADHGLPPAALTLEVVEDTLMADPERGRTVLTELRALGVRTSIDDYGTGYSSLAYLRYLPVDELKLDRSLTQDVGVDARAGAIVRHTVALAHDLGLSLVAEGVEDGGTQDVLAALGCDIAQGFVIARPMPVDDFLSWLDRPAPAEAVLAQASSRG